MEILPRFSILFALFVTCHGLNNFVGKTPAFDAIYQFGDSVSDTGNDVQLDANNGCGKPPYGITMKGKPTGRCSDGFLIVDWFAKSFKLPLLSPYLNKAGDFKHGANFAVAGATALATSGTSLPKQLEWFKSHLATICKTPAACKPKLENALFVVGEIGGNDYNTEGFKSNDSIPALKVLVPKVVASISDTLKQLIASGGRKFLVPGNFPVGCMTIYLSAHKSKDPKMYDQYGCLNNWNALATIHNTQLQAAIKTLQAQNPTVKIAYGDYYSGVYNILKNTATLGFDKAGIHKACCGGGNDLDYNFGAGCGSKEGTVCPNPNARLSWDGIHLTQHAYQVMAGQLLKTFMPILAN